MADTKISDLSAASALDGTELVPIVQGGETVRATASAIAALSGVKSVSRFISNAELTSGSAIQLVAGIPGAMLLPIQAVMQAFPGSVACYRGEGGTGVYVGPDSNGIFLLGFGDISQEETQQIKRSIPDNYIQTFSRSNVDGEDLYVIYPSGPAIGQIDTFTILAAGTGYAIGDTGSVGHDASEYSEAYAQYEITAVTDGAVTGLSIVSGGIYGYMVYDIMTLRNGGSQPGSGNADAQITVTSITPTDAEIYITVHYVEVPVYTPA